MPDYLKEAFLFRWNLLFFLGGAAAAAMTPLAPVLLPLVAAGELTYLAGLVSVPRFRAAIDAKVHAAGKGAADTAAGPAAPPVSLVQMLNGLPAVSRVRFERLHARCVEMRGIAAGVRGASDDDHGAAEEIRTPGLDRLLWLFLRLLMSKAALDRFLQSMNEQEIASRLAELRKSVAAQTPAAGQPAADDRILRSLQDSFATAQLRMDNITKARSNAEFVAAELDRLENKIQAVTEMAVSHSDPDEMSSRIDAIAEGISQTEQTIRELQTITGMTAADETPSILGADIAQPATLGEDPGARARIEQARLVAEGRAGRRPKGS